MAQSKPATQSKIEAVLALRGAGRAAIGRDRIALLEAVEAHGSITRAAQAVGLSYKGAWDAVDAVNNLLPRPAVAAQTGGRRGGGAVLTADGKALVAGFRLIEDRLGRAAALLAADGDTPLDPLALLWSLGMKTSARNALRCTIAEIRTGGVSAEVILRLTADITLAAIITEESVRDLDLLPGQEVTALIKSSFVMLAGGETPPAVSARNRIPGIVARRDDGPVNCEITLDIGDGKTITSVLTRDGADSLDLLPGSRAWALVKASHVILAVD